MSTLLLIAGLALLIVSGEILVKGAVSAALRFRISPAVIGLTVVSLGTSAPELLVSVQAAIHGHADIAIGNIIGSNIANLALVLGVTVLITPILMVRDTMRIDYPAMMVATVLFIVMIWDLHLGVLEGSIFVLSLALFVAFMIHRSRKIGFSQAVSDIPSKSWAIHWAVLAVVAGCVGLVFGANWFLQGAESIARNLGVSDHLIGVTLVAFGTSLPELVTSIIAAIRKQADLLVGNLIGSNIFNIFGVLGVTSIVKPIDVDPRVLSSDVWWMFGCALALLPMMLLGKRFGRRKGAVLFLIYLAYITFVILGEKQ